MSLQKEILEATKMIADFKRSFPNKSVDEIVQVINDNYPKLRNALGALNKQVADNTKAMAKESAERAERVKKNMAEFTKQTADKAKQTVGSAKQAASGAAKGAAETATKGVSKVAKVAAKAKPFIKSGIIGLAADQQLRSHTATEAQEQEAYNKWLEQKELEKGLRYPNLQKELGEEIVFGASGRKYHIVGDKAYDFATGKPVIVNDFLDDITQKYQGQPSAQENKNQQVKAPEMSDPKDWPFKNGNGAPVSNSGSGRSIGLPPVPRIQDMNPNPNIVDVNTGVPMNVQNLPPIRQPEAQAQGGTPASTEGVPTGGASAPTTFTFNPYQSTVDYGLSADEKSLMPNEATQVSPQEIYQSLQEANAARMQAIANDPRYQGGLIPAQGYDIDPVAYDRAQRADLGRELIKELGGPDFGSNAQRMANNAKMQYEMNIARQAGVPYEDYKAAMLERQKQEILARQQEVESYLKLQAQQTTDMKERLNIMQQIYDTRVKAQKDIDVANANAYGDVQKQYLTNIGNANVANITQRGGIMKQEVANRGNADVANINAMGDIKKQRELLDDPVTKTKATSAFYGSTFGLPVPIQRGIIQNMSEEQQKMMFGRTYTPEQLQNIYGTGSPAMQQQQGNEQSLFNRFMGKIRGIQANEQ